MKPITSSQNSQQLIREIRELHAQYAKEVPTPRGPWPESIKARVKDLWDAGITSKEIAESTGVPAQTMYGWKSQNRRRQDSFQAIAVITTKPVPLNLPLPQSEKSIPPQIQLPKQIPTVTVVLPNGIRLEGLDADSAFKLARAF